MLTYAPQLGFFYLHDFWNAGFLSETSLASLLWGLMLSTVISSKMCQLCIFLQKDDATPSQGKNATEPAEAKYQWSEDAGSREGSPLQFSSRERSPEKSGNTVREAPLLYKKTSRDVFIIAGDPSVPGHSEVSQERQTTESNFLEPSAKSDNNSLGREAPMLYNAISPNDYITKNDKYRGFVPPPLEPSPKQAPPSGPSGGVSFSFDNGGGMVPARGVPIRMDNYPNSTSGVIYERPTGMSDPITAIPINSQVRRTVPSIWADEE